MIDNLHFTQIYKLVVSKIEMNFLLTFVYLLYICYVK